MKIMSLLRSPNFWVSFIGVASLVVGLFALYFGLREPEPGVTYEVIGDTNVLDLRRSLQDLNVVFRGQDIEKQNLSLRIITINVVNSGDVDILSIHFDQADDWGIQFGPSEVIEARVIDTSSAFLQSKLTFLSASRETVVFPKVNFDEGASFTVETLLLHPKEATPSISPVGKIAGINEIDVVQRPLPRQDVGFIAQLLQGSAVVHFVRTIAYYLSSIAISVGVILAIIEIQESLDRRKTNSRRRRVSQTKVINRIEEENVKQFLISQYESRGIDGLRELQKLINAPEAFEWESPAPRWVAHGRRSSYRPTEEDMSVHENLPVYVAPRRFFLLHGPELLNDLGVLSKGDDGVAVVAPTFREAIKGLLAELDE